MKSLRWVGLLFSLLIVGVLGGLMAPLPSNAQTVASRPQLYIEVYLGTSTTPAVPRQQISLGNPVTCPSGGPNYCYPLTTAAYNNSGLNYGPTNRQFRIENFSSTNLARVNITDKATSSSTSPADVIVVTGLKLVPIVTTAGWPSTDKVTVRLIVRNKFDSQPNPPANGTSSFYPFGMSVGGMYQTSPSPAGNFYQMYGVGTFITNSNGTVPSGQPKKLSNDQNTDADFIPSGVDSRCVDGSSTKVPLCRYIAGATTTQAGFNSSQKSAYYPGGSQSTPTTTRFACTNNLTGNNKQVIDPTGVTRTYNDPSCQPLIEETHRFLILGPDIIILSASSHGGGGVCGEGPHLPKCDCTNEDSGKGKGKKNSDSMCDAILTFITDENEKEKDLQGDVPDVIPCSTAICNGTLKIIVRVTPDGDPLEFPFIAEGPGVSPENVQTGQAGLTFTNLITGHGGAEGGGTDIVIYPDYANPDWPRPDSNSFYQVDQILPSSANGSTIIGIDTEVLSCPGGNKGPLIIHFIGRDATGNPDTVTADFHVHNSQSPPAVCPF